MYPKNLIVTLLLLLVSFPLFAQNLSLFDSTAFNKVSLNRLYGTHKEFIPGLELQSLLALSHYPELKDAHITFKLAGKESTAKTTVTFGSIFRGKGKHIIIYINSDKTATGFRFTDLPFNAQVGVIGHELAHALDFRNRGFFGMAWWGISYMGQKKRMQIERGADRTEIDHGLGSQLYTFGRYINDNESICDRYRAYRRKYYLNTEDVLQRMSIYEEKRQD